VVHCAVHGAPREPDYGERSAAAGAAFAETWGQRLAASGHRLTAGDMANIGHAGALVAALSVKPTNTRVDRTDVVSGIVHSLSVGTGSIVKHNE
jgi:hypothetical protein